MSTTIKIFIEISQRKNNRLRWKVRKSIIEDVIFDPGFRGQIECKPWIDQQV